MRFIARTAPLIDERNVIDTSPRVLAMGLPRCATSSMQAAFERLGFTPSLHMAHVLPYPERERMVVRALVEKDKEERQKILRQLCGGFAATADFPGMMFADDLMDLYPDAPVILNQRRDAATWHQSAVEGLAFFASWMYKIVCFPVTTDRLQLVMITAAEKKMHERLGVGLWDEACYARHNQWVRDEAAKRGKKVLEFQASDGWGPLCKFIGVDAPDEPFPWVNDRETMKKLKQFIIVRGIAYWVAIFGSGYACWHYGPKAAQLLADSFLGRS